MIEGSQKESSGDYLVWLPLYFAVVGAFTTTAKEIKLSAYKYVISDCRTCV